MKRSRKVDTVKSKSILSYFSTNKANEKIDIEDVFDFNSNNSNDAIISKNETITLDSQPKNVNISNIKDNHYSISNFNKVLAEIFNNKNDLILYNQEELNILENYKILSLVEKKLFLKIFNRNHNWHRYDKETINNGYNSFKNLINNGFISNDLTKLDLLSKLELLQIDELNTLMKKFTIKSRIKKKQEIIDSLLSITNEQNQISQFFISKSSNSLLEKLESELKQFLRSTCIINLNIRKTFCKTTVLFALTDGNWKDFQHIGEKNQHLMFFLLQISRGEVSMPLFKLSRVSNIFTDVENFDNYVTNLEYLMKLRNLFDNKKYDNAMKVYEEFALEFPFEKIEKADHINHLPTFLRRFSVSSVMIDIHSIGVDIMEKMRQYSEAVCLLKRLLDISQSYSGVSKRRGKWYFRLCLNLKHHLKDNNKSREWLEKALTDKTTPPSFQLTFKNRLDKIDSNISDTVQKNLNDDDDSSVVDFTEIKFSIDYSIIIEAPTQYQLGGQTHRPQYLWKDGDKSVYCHVEDYVILHYLNNNGFTNGIHGETNTFITFYLLLFYDIIYADVPDVFYSYQQTVPLDLYSGTFRSNRLEIIERKIDWLKIEASESDINDLLKDNWKRHYNELGIVSDWRLFKDEEQLLGLFWSLGLNIVLKVCEKFIENFNYWSSGMPDLVMWNDVTKKHEIIEVKGPGDKLSDKQKLWIMELQSMAANVSLCQVKGVSHRKI